MNKQQLIPIFLLALLLSPLWSGVAAAATINPSSASALVNFPMQFTLSGLNESAQYTAYLNGVSYTTFTATTSGEATLTVTFSAAGTYILTLKQNGTGSVVASANITVTDIMEILIPCIVLLVTISIVMGIVKNIKV